MHQSATISRCGQYRYLLTRTWDQNLPPVVFIGLNPSTADDRRNDPTIRRCISFARLWNAGGVVMVNLFAYRSTDPVALKSVPDPIGPENDDWLLKTTCEAPIVIAAWGVNAPLLRVNQVRELVPYACHLGMTKSGQPRHPLYVRRDIEPVVAWDRRSELTPQHREATSCRLAKFTSLAVTHETELKA